MNKKIVLIIILILTILALLLVLISRPSYSFNSVSVDEKQWNSIISERTKLKSLTLEKIFFNDYELIIDEDSNKLYYSLVNNSSTKYSPSISFKASESGAKIAVLKDEIDDSKVMNNHEFKVMIYTEDSYKVYGLYCTMLPFLNITYDESELLQVNIPMNIYIFDNLAKSTNRIIKSEGEFSIKEKKSGDEYSFSMSVVSPGNNKRENMISLFNMEPHKEYLLKHSSEDKMGLGIEVFINNKYQGLYELDFNGKKDDKLDRIN